MVLHKLYKGCTFEENNSKAFLSLTIYENMSNQSDLIDGISFEQFVCNNPEKDDHDMRGNVNDGIWTNNLQKYFCKYMAIHGKKILHEFWNHRSDACPLEADLHDEQLIAFDQYVSSKFKTNQQ